MIRTKGIVIQRGNEADFTKRRSRERWESRVPALARAIVQKGDRSLCPLLGPCPEVNILKMVKG